MSRINLWIDLCRESLPGGLIYIGSMMVAILAALILHECAHGYMALRCGDPTAKMMGRLSLNPARHLDPIGTVCMVLFGFGWARPVPVNPRNYGDFRRDDILVSVAGIVVNLTLFILSVALLRGLRALAGDTMAALVNGNGIVTPKVIGWLNEGRMVGFGGGYLYGKVTTVNAVSAYVYQFVHMFASINLSLAIFNFLPVPPLDGYHLFNDIIFKGRFRLSAQQFQMAQMILMLLCFSGAIGQLLGFVHEAVFSAVANLFNLL